MHQVFQYRHTFAFFSVKLSSFALSLEVSGRKCYWSELSIAMMVLVTLCSYVSSTSHVLLHGQNKKC